MGKAVVTFFRASFQRRKSIVNFATFLKYLLLCVNATRSFGLIILELVSKFFEDLLSVWNRFFVFFENMLDILLDRFEDVIEGAIVCALYILCMIINFCLLKRHYMMLIVLCAVLALIYILPYNIKEQYSILYWKILYAYSCSFFFLVRILDIPHVIVETMFILGVLFSLHLHLKSLFVYIDTIITLLLRTAIFILEKITGEELELEIENIRSQTPSMDIHVEHTSEKPNIICVICKEREKRILVFPCRHLCMCQECFTLDTYNKVCPVCRKEIENILVVYV